MAGLNLQAHLLKPVRSSLLLKSVCDVVANNREQQTVRERCLKRKQAEPAPRTNERISRWRCSLQKTMKSIS